MSAMIDAQPAVDALMENCFASLKTERLEQEHFATRNAAHRDI